MTATFAFSDIYLDTSIVAAAISSNDPHAVSCTTFCTQLARDNVTVHFSQLLRYCWRNRRASVRTQETRHHVGRICVPRPLFLTSPTVSYYVLKSPSSFGKLPPIRVVSCRHRCTSGTSYETSAPIPAFGSNGCTSAWRSLMHCSARSTAWT